MRTIHSRRLSCDMGPRTYPPTAHLASRPEGCRSLAARAMPEPAPVTSASRGLGWSWQNRSRIQTQLKGVGVADERRSGAVQPEEAQVLRHRVRAVGDRQAHGTRQAKPAFATGDRGAPQGLAAVL